LSDAGRRVRARLALALLALPVLAACQEDGTPPAKADPEARTECLAQGGRYEIGGILQEYYCFLQTPDGGQPCSKGADCNGLCLAESRSCSTERPLFGCIDMLDDAGETVTICID